jgi:ParB family transcriptional regulator, chromosome partitioning protein
MSNVKQLAIVPQNQSTDAVEVIHRIPVHHIRPNPHQPRKKFSRESLVSLAKSIKEDGQHEAIKVKPVNDERAHQEGVKYELIDGERRWRSALIEEGEITHLKAIIKEVNATRQYELSCAMNFNRESHTGHEELMMVRELVVTYGNTETYVATLLGKSLPWVNLRRLAHERLCQAVLIALKDERVPISVALTLSKLTHNDQVRELKNYLNGGSHAQVKAALEKATRRGHVQGAVRKPEAKEYRRLITTVGNQLNASLERLEAFGMTELVRSVRIGGPDEVKRVLGGLQKGSSRLQQFIRELSKVHDM